MTRTKAWLLTGVGMCLGAPAAAATVSVEQPLHAFVASEGTSPQSALLPDGQGGFYGTANGGGAYHPKGGNNFGYGTIFHLVPPAGGQGNWTVTVLHNFNRTDGTYTGDLVRGRDGALYGVASYGGSKGCQGSGCGTAYRLAPPHVAGGAWSYSVIHEFKETEPFGIDPAGGLIAGSDGSLYGMAEGGGALGYGAIFKLAPPASPGGAWSLTDLHNFGFADGAYPFSALSGDPGKALYGATSFGGVGCKQGPGCGTVFDLTPPAASGGQWQFHLLYRFANAQDGEQPEAAVVLGRDGALYGTTSQGAPGDFGEVFRLAPPATGGSVWTKTAIHVFRDFPDGEAPQSRLLVGPGGALYGNTYAGGTPNSGQCSTYGCGTIFRMRPPAAGGSHWQFTVLHAFAGAPDGGFPSFNPLTLQGDTLFETTYEGGTDCGIGIPFNCGGAAISLHR